jgi:hypothetical protein
MKAFADLYAALDGPHPTGHGGDVTRERDLHLAASRCQTWFDVQSVRRDVETPVVVSRVIRLKNKGKGHAMQRNVCRLTWQRLAKKFRVKSGGRSA